MEWKLPKKAFFVARLHETPQANWACAQRNQSISLFIAEFGPPTRRADVLPKINPPFGHGEPLDCFSKTAGLVFHIRKKSSGG